MNHDFESLMECNKRESEQATLGTLSLSHPRAVALDPKRRNVVLTQSLALQGTASTYSK